jgi:hypothetical protein
MYWKEPLKMQPQQGFYTTFEDANSFHIYEHSASADTPLKNSGDKHELRKI